MPHGCSELAKGPQALTPDAAFGSSPTTCWSVSFDESALLPWRVGVTVGLTAHLRGGTESMYVTFSKQVPTQSKCLLNTSPWSFLLLWGGTWRWCCHWRKGTGALSTLLGIQGQAPGRGTREPGARAGPRGQGPGAAQLWDLLQGLTVAPGSWPFPPLFHILSEQG